MKPPSAVCYSDTLPVATSWRCAGGEDCCPPRVCVPECPGANDHHCQPGDLTACDKTTAEEPRTSLPLMLILREQQGQGSRKKEACEHDRRFLRLKMEGNLSCPGHLVITLPVVCVSVPFVLI